ncbi:MAG: PLP-dependent aminotransferase family protein [Planctomycetales bacterium]|nr:PLP-dependent aminotransferase family protein [Planctomycetales bacterium]
MDNFDSLLSRAARSIKASEIREILKLTRGKEIISFAGGLPDPSVFPAEDLADCAATVLRGRGASALQYGPSAGDSELLDEAARWMEAEHQRAQSPRTSPPTIDNLLVTSGSQQGLDLLGKLLLDPGDVVLVALPSYLGALQAFDSRGAKFVGVQLDEQGICPAALEQQLGRLRDAGVRPKMVYVIPDFQNPTGVCLTLERRRRIVELVHEYDTLLIEDCPYRQLRYSGDTLPTCHSLDESGRTIVLNTFSKVTAPGLRLGWLTAHASVIEKLVLLKQATDLCTSSLNQAVAAEYCRRGLLASHLRLVIDTYREKRDAMLDALERHMPQREGLRWTRPEGGLFLWLTLPPELDARELLPKAIAAQVAYVIGGAFHCDGSGQNTMRLNFSYPSLASIDIGVRRLAQIIGA